VLAALIAGAVYLRTRPQGLAIVDIPAVDSRGYIAALLEKDGATKLVAILPDGSVREAPGGGDFFDSELTWKPDGRRVLFTSNRSKGGSIQVFEWIPDRNSDPVQLTPGGASRQNPWFAPDGKEFVYASGGDILATSYPLLHSRQIMPPSDSPDGHETEGGDHVHAPGDEHEHDLVSTVWTQYSAAIEGEAFRKAYVDGSVLLGEYTFSRGQALIIQNMNPSSAPEAVPQAPFGGDALDVSFHGASGRAVVAIIGFKFVNLNDVPRDQIGPDGRVKLPFVNALFALGLRDQSVIPIFLAPDDAQTIVSPSISPDGREVAFVIMEKVEGTKRATGLLVAPIAEGGVKDARIIAQGEISSPSWSPDGQKLVFVRDGDILTVGADGLGESNWTKGKGRYSTPLFSPMR
jgi:dipeptidyl aminopeptidase/acylaminoacyl peptidase